MKKGFQEIEMKKNFIVEMIISKNQLHTHILNPKYLRTQIHKKHPQTEVLKLEKLQKNAQQDDLRI